MIQLLFKEPKVKSNMFKAKHSINRPIDPCESSINTLSKFYSASYYFYLGNSCGPKVSLKHIIVSLIDSSEMGFRGYDCTDYKICDHKRTLLDWDQ